MLKLFISSILALIFLSLGATFYYNLPNTYTNLDGTTFNAEVTDRRYVPHSSYLQLREGFGRGRTNNEGYMNLFDYTPSMKIDTLIMGSSHMQAFEVAMEESTASVLGKLSGKTVYNIGMGANYFSVCVQNLKAAIEKYKPSEYVILETSSEVFTDKELLNILDFNIPNVYKNLKRNMFYLWIRKNPYFILLSKQLQDWFSHEQHEQAVVKQTYNNPILLKKVLQYIKETVSQTGAKTIILYHPAVSLNKDGGIDIRSNTEYIKQLTDLCEQFGIYFLDMSKRYVSEYKENYVLPYGFMNTSIGKGHTNRFGHKMNAEEIYKLMQQIEGKS